MKCFEIKKGKIIKGFPVFPLSSPDVVIKKGRIYTAGFLLEAPPEDDEGFTNMLSTDLSAASELTCFELTKADNRKTYKHSLVMINPVEVRRAPDLGDSSDIVYRSPTVAILRCPLEGCVLRDLITDGRLYISNPRVPLKVVTKGGGAYAEVVRSAIEHRRKKETIVYAY
jgi:hypothetical protein